MTLARRKDEGRAARCLAAVGMISAAVLGGSHAALADAQERVLVDERLGGSCAPSCPPALLTIDGRPNALDTRMYDITISSASTPQRTYGIFTNGFVGAPVHVQVPANSGNSLRFVVRYRYDDDAGFCVFIDNGHCVAWVRGGPPAVEFDPGRAPRFNNDWRLGDDFDELVDWGSPPRLEPSGSDASLILELYTVMNGQASLQRVVIPFLGQAVAAIPQ